MPLPDSVELLAEVRNPSLDPEPLTSKICPSAIVLSGCADGTLGQVKPRPSAVTDAPGVSPAAARPCAENVVPCPSKPSKLGLGLRLPSSVMPVLS